MTLTVYSPTKTLYSGEVTLCEVPGGRGRFTVLPGHDSIVSTLVAGEVRYNADGSEQRLAISGGYVKVKDDVVTICAKG